MAKRRGEKQRQEQRAKAQEQFKGQSDSDGGPYAYEPNWNSGWGEEFIPGFAPNNPFQFQAIHGEKARFGTSFIPQVPLFPYQPVTPYPPACYFGYSPSYPQLFSNIHNQWHPLSQMSPQGNNTMWMRNNPVSSSVFTNQDNKLDPFPYQEKISQTAERILELPSDSSEEAANISPSGPIQPGVVHEENPEVSEKNTRSPQLEPGRYESEGSAIESSFSSFSDEEGPAVEKAPTLADKILLPNSQDEMARKKAGPRKDKMKSALKRQKAKDAAGKQVKGLISRVGSTASSRKPGAAGMFLTAAAARIVPGEGVLQYATDNRNMVSDAAPSVENHEEEGFIAFDTDESDAEMDTGLASQFAQYEEENEKQQEEDLEKFDKIARPVPEAAAPWLRLLPSDRPRSSLVERITNEIKAFTEFVSPTVQEQRKRESLVKRIQGLARRMWPGSRASLFGSFATGMYLPGADVDLVINTPERRLDNRREMYRLGERIKRQGWADSVEVIARARVPIVKFVDKTTGLSVDISFEQPSALAAVRTTQEWLKKEPAIKPLTLVVKQMLRRKKLNEVVHGGLGGYATVCLIAHLLFTHPKLKSGEMRTENNLGVLLLEFFMHYGQNFDCRRNALVMTGDMRVVPKSSNVNLQTSIVDGLAIQDPNDPNNNVCRASFNWIQVRRSFVQAADLLRRQSAEYIDASASVRAHHSFLAPVLMYNESRPQQARLPSIPRSQTGRPDPSRTPPLLKRKNPRNDPPKTEKAPIPLAKRLRLDPFVAVESSSSSGDENQAPKSAPGTSGADSSDGDTQDSRTWVTTAQKRKFWQNKGQTVTSGTSS